METQHYHPGCSSGFDLDLQVLEWPLPCPPEGFRLSDLHGSAQPLSSTTPEQYYSSSTTSKYSYQSPSHMMKSYRWPSLCLDFSSTLCSDSPLQSAPLLGFFLHMDFSSPPPIYLINKVLAGWAVSWVWLPPQWMPTHHIIQSISPKDLPERRILDQEVFDLTGKNMKVAGLDPVLMLPLDFMKRAPLPQQSRAGIVLNTSVERH